MWTMIQSKKAMTQDILDLQVQDADYDQSKKAMTQERGKLWFHQYFKVTHITNLAQCRIIIK